MRAAVVTDIHGNRRAFRAVLRDLKHAAPDLIVHGGDLVFGGTHPAEIVDEIRPLDWPGVLGNTDEVLWTQKRLTKMVAAHPKLAPLLGRVPGELVRFSAMSHCYTEAKQQFANHSHLPGLAIDGKRLLSVFRKIARGIFFHEQAQRLVDNELLLFRDADVIAKGLDFAISTQSWPEVDMGEPFRYRSRHDPEGSIIWFEFYRTTWWFAMRGEAARTYPQAEETK